jgi:hypothetical protein
MRKASAAESSDDVRAQIEFQGKSVVKYDAVED